MSCWPFFEFSGGKHGFVKILITLYVEVLEQFSDTSCGVILELWKFSLLDNFRIFNVYHAWKAEYFLAVACHLQNRAVRNVLGNKFYQRYLPYEWRGVFDNDNFGFTHECPQNRYFFAELAVDLRISKRNGTVKKHFVEIFQIGV